MYSDCIMKIALLPDYRQSYYIGYPKEKQEWIAFFLIFQQTMQKFFLIFSNLSKKMRITKKEEGFRLPLKDCTNYST